MLLYSKTILSFIARLKGYAQEIIIEEMGLGFRSNRIRDGIFSLPLEIVVFERPGIWGYFDHNFYQIGLHKKLMYYAKTTVIKNILRHELAHLMTYAHHGSKVAAHGPEFRQYCQLYGWGKDISLAKSNIEMDNLGLSGDLVSEKVIAKVKKLLSLAGSPNTHEAAAATAKANSLLLQHNLQSLADIRSGSAEIKSGEEEVTCVKRVLNAKRTSGKLQAIFKILSTFYIRPIFCHSAEGGVYLEVVGPKTNVELADYMANFLDRELERLWKESQKKHPELRGISAKRSFMLALAYGYMDKIADQQKKHGQETTNHQQALVAIEKKLDHMLSMTHPRLRSSRQRGRKFCSFAADLGEAQGKGLSIKSALPGECSGRGGSTPKLLM